jgi:hypothetical protein
MSGLTLGIVLIAALLHAGWNFLIKKSRNKNESKLFYYFNMVFDMP